MKNVLTQAMENGVLPIVEIPTYEEYKKKFKELHTVYQH